MSGVVHHTPNRDFVVQHVEQTQEVSVLISENQVISSSVLFDLVTREIAHRSVVWVCASVDDDLCGGGRPPPLAP